MGVDGLNSIHYYGVAQNGNLGQNNNANQPWPMANANDYVRAIDFTQPASRATWVNYAVPVTGGAAAQGHRGSRTSRREQRLGAAARDLDHTRGDSSRAPRPTTRPCARRRRRQALSGGDVQRAGQVARRSAVPGRRLHQRRQHGREVQTWVEHPVFGDMLVETEYTHYRDNNGLKYPVADRAEARRLADVPGVHCSARMPNPAEPAAADDAAPPAAGRAGAPGGRPAAPAATGPTSEKLADGVFRITRRVQRAGHRVRRPRRCSSSPGRRTRRGRTGHHRRDQAGHSEQADPLRRHLAPSLRSHRRHRRGGGRRHHIVTPEVNRAFL